MAETKRMTPEQVVRYLLEEDGVDFVRESLLWVVRQLMEAEVSELQRGSPAQSFRRKQPRLRAQPTLMQQERVESLAPAATILGSALLRRVRSRRRWIPRAGSTTPAASPLPAGGQATRRGGRQSTISPHPSRG
jgi:hypothetical protein